jgi:transposase, IS30 family
MAGSGRVAWNRTPDEVRDEIRRRIAAGEGPSEVADAMGVVVRTVFRVIAEAGGMPCRRVVSGCRLSLADREEISRGLHAEDTLSAIAVRIGRHVSTVSREVKAGGGRDLYRAWRADREASQRRARPKTEKLAAIPRLGAAVEVGLLQGWSPEQISGRLPMEFPDDHEMRVSPETIYQSLFLQGRGALRKELVHCLRSGRTRRRPQRRAVTGRGRIPDMVMITERPAEIEDRAVPGHWEGDLLLGGTASASSLGTLVERTSRLVLLFPLGQDRSAEHTRVKLAETIQTLPAQMRRSITWDQGSEMAGHARFSIDTGVQIYFCHPHSPWERGTNENTNGLLRQYFPKGADLRHVTQDDCDAVAASLNNRPRKTLGFKTPLESFTELLLASTA